MATLASLGATSVAPRAAAPRRVANARGVARAPPSRGVARCAKRGESRGDRALARAWDARDGRRARGGERGDAAAARAHAAGARAFEARRHRGSGVAHAAAGAVDGGDASGSTPGVTIVKPKVSAGKLQTRIASALVLGAAGAGVIVAGGVSFALFMSLASFLASKEYFTLASNMSVELPYPPEEWVNTMCVAMCTAFPIILFSCGGKLNVIVQTMMGAYGVTATLLMTKQKDPHFSQFTSVMFGFFYCGFLPSFWVKLRALAWGATASAGAGSTGSAFISAWPAAFGGPGVWTTGLIATIIAVLCIIASDVGAYVVGKTFGKHQLIPLSPNKTIEGAVGGLVSTVGAAFALRWLLGWQAGVVQTTMLGCVIFWSAVAGDLMESVMKRNANMKDSGNIIPGHGGFLDRFDSYLFTGIAVYFFIVTVMPAWFQGVVL